MREGLNAVLLQGMGIKKRNKLTAAKMGEEKINEKRWEGVKWEGSSRCRKCCNWKN